MRLSDLLQLLLQRQFVEGLAKCKLPVDLLLRNAKVGDVEEALGANGLDQLLGQGMLVALEAGQVDIGD